MEKDKVLPKLAMAEPKKFTKSFRVDAKVNQIANEVFVFLNRNGKAASISALSHHFYMLGLKIYLESETIFDDLDEELTNHLNPLKNVNYFQRNAEEKKTFPRVQDTREKSDSIESGYPRREEGEKQKPTNKFLPAGNKINSK